MKSNNPFIDSFVESQTNLINSWVDSAKKMQAAFSDTNMANEGQSIFKEWLEKQAAILDSMKNSAGTFSSNVQPQDFFKNWFEQQTIYARQMEEFGKGLVANYTKFTKPAYDLMGQFGQSGNFGSLYNNWVTILNQFEAAGKNMQGMLNKDVFSNFLQANQMYAKMQEFFQPMAEAMRSGQFNFEAFKNNFTPENYELLSKQIFGNLYQGAPMKDLYDNGMKQMQEFFVSQHHLGKDYYSKMKEMSQQFPQMLSGNMDQLKELYNQINNVFGKTFEPLLKLVSPGREKEMVEGTIALMDKIAEYSIKQAEMQLQLQVTTQKGIEKVAQQYSSKFENPDAMKQSADAKEIYNDWVKINEELFTELFASPEFSRLKGDTLNLTMDIKKHFEKQFERSFENFPVVFKSEVEELHKAVYELKKQVKDLQGKLADAVVETADEDKSGRARKK